jgi:hypothetical protein
MVVAVAPHPSRRPFSMHKAEPSPVEVSTVSLRALLDQKVGAADGDVGTVRDFFFDPSTWTLRYVEADAGGWLPGRVLMFSAPCFGSRPFGLSAEEPDMMRVALTRLKIERGPAGHTGPAAPAPLRGFRALLGRPLRGSVGPGVTLRDFIVDRRTWRIREMVVGTGRWFSSREVRVDAGDFEPFVGADDAPGVNLTRAEMDEAPRDGLARRAAKAVG